MKSITLTKGNFKFNKETNTIRISGKKVPFQTSYNVTNAKNGNTIVLNFSHSTGSEWDPSTLWVYKTEKKIGYATITLEVLNDDVTPAHAEVYMRAKLRNVS